MTGLVDIGIDQRERVRRQVTQTANINASLENQGLANKAQEQAAKAQLGTTIGSTVGGIAGGAAGTAMLGTQLGTAAGPVGMAAGAVIGGIAGYFGADLF